MASKILIVGDVNGQLSSVFKKLSTLHSKNNFSFAIVTGDLFDGEDNEDVANILAEKIPIPLPTYFTIGTKPFPQRITEKLSRDDDICPNLHFLGKRSTTKTSEGVRIVTLGGRFDDSIVAGLSKEQFLPFHTIDDAKSLRGANTADILLTTSWPTDIRTRSKVPIPDGAAETSSYKHISDLCASLKPRYHFSASEFYYEREPFFHSSDQENPPTTRFISMAAYGNASKQKSFYALTLQPSSDPTNPPPSNTTPSPFLPRAEKRPALDPAPYSRFSDGGDRTYHRHKRGRRERPPPPDPSECFFCLSNTNLATHLVASIGEDAYVTTAKGPLTTSSTYSASGLNFPGHMLIIPLTHSPTIALIPEEDLAAKSYSEMKRYKTALQSTVGSRSDYKIGAVTYEISRGNGIHTHWQFLPVSETLITKGLVEAAFRVEAENMSYPAFQVRDPGLGKEEGDFFRVWIWAPDEKSTEGSTKCLTLPLGSDARFDLQFGRRVLAKLLGLEKRIQWRDCAQTEAEEKTDVEAFKEAFKMWDFS